MTQIFLLLGTQIQLTNNAQCSVSWYVVLPVWTMFNLQQNAIYFTLTANDLNWVYYTSYMLWGLWNISRIWFAYGLFSDKFGYWYYPITKPEVYIFKYLEHHLCDITLMSSTDMFRLLPGLDLGREWSVWTQRWWRLWASIMKISTKAFSLAVLAYVSIADFIELHMWG